MSSYVSNNEEWITTASGTFYLVQRNVGFSPNDGSWNVSITPELYWSEIGTLRSRRDGAFLGNVKDKDEALKLINETPLPEENDKMVVSMGMSSS